ncbi:MAG: hypothetical protein JWP89_3527 [Schlesneria sp.]|nr:hypothetical protein [Schlesneria sp.]
MKIAPALCLISLTILSGCGGRSDKIKVAPASGIVKYKGEPLADANITFYPEKGPVGTAKSDAKGAFQIQTNGQPGAVPGKSKVTVSVASSTIPPSDGRAHEFVAESKIPKKYASDAETDLTVDVAPAGSKDLQLNLTE